jgi:hypothetical protein
MEGMNGDIYMVAGSVIGIAGTLAFICVRTWLAPRMKETKKLIDSLYED